MKNYCSIALACLCVFQTGCASIVSGANQSLSVETRKKGEAVVNAYCKLTNNKGTWFVTTPGSVTVNRSYVEMAVRCEKDGVEPGIATVKSSTKAMAFGNILFGGIIGVGVDVATGSAYDYPSLFTIEMGGAVAIAAMTPEPSPSSTDAFPCAIKQSPGCTN